MDEFVRCFCSYLHLHQPGFLVSGVSGAGFITGLGGSISTPFSYCESLARSSIHNLAQLQPAQKWHTSHGRVVTTIIEEVMCNLAIASPRQIPLRSSAV